MGKPYWNEVLEETFSQYYIYVRVWEKINNNKSMCTLLLVKKVWNVPGRREVSAGCSGRSDELSPSFAANSSWQSPWQDTDHSPCAISGGAKAYVASSVRVHAWKVNNIATAVPDWSLVQGTGEREECHCGFLRLPKGFRPCLASRPTVPTAHLGVSEWSVKWLTSYLSERQISVRFGSAMSEYKDYLLSWSCSFYRIYQ